MSGGTGEIGILDHLTSKSLLGPLLSWNQLSQDYYEETVKFLNGEEQKAVTRDLEQLSLSKCEVSLPSEFTQANIYRAIVLLLRQISGPVSTCVIDGTQLILLSAA